MSDLEFTVDWTDPDAIAGPELAATWASLSIRVQDSIITRVFDERSRTVRDTIFVPLYPLAEWLVTNWWFLSYEVENQLKEGDADFRRRHALDSVGEGYAFPDLKVVPSGGLMDLSWMSSRKTWTRTRFLEEGRTWIEEEVFRERCSELIDRVIGRLEDFGVHDTLLQEEWTAIQAADPEETAFCGTAAGLGWDPYGLDDEKCAAVLDLDRILEGIALEEAVAAIDPENMGPSSRAIRDAAIWARRNSLPLRNLGVSSHEISVDNGVFPVRDRPDSEHAGNAWAAAPGWRKPWDEGYHLARCVRQALGVDGKPLPTIADIADAIGEVPEELEKVTRPTDFGPATLVEGVVTRDEAGNPGFAFRAVRDDAKRFLFCRALADVLSPSGSGTLLTRAGSGRQRRSRAFAAEFLAPSSALAARVSSSIVAEEEIDGLAEEFGVSPLVIEHQINNHDIARIWPDG